MLGEVVGNYRITAALSSGGMGAVYRAEHTLIGKAAAVKVLLPEWSANRDIVARFFNEARMTTTIRHPGIVEIFDFGHDASGRAYLVMELLSGESLASRLARVRRIPEPIALGLIRSTVSALAAAHAVGVVHRDLKPDNVFLVPDPDVPGGERPKLLDFGIAKLTDGRASSRVTSTGTVIGTPTYMAPEQCRGLGAIDGRADLYALGCIFYEMLCGRPPFESESAGELMAAHLMTTPAPVQQFAPEVGASVSDVIARLLAKSPGDRYGSALELLEALGGTPRDAGGRPVALITPAHLTPAQLPTTMSGAARAIAAPPARRRPLLAAGLAAVTVLAIVGGVLASGRGGQGNPVATAAPVVLAPPIDAAIAIAVVARDAPVPIDAAPDAAIDAPPPPPAAPRHHAIPPRPRPTPIAPTNPGLPSLDGELPKDL